MDGRDFTERAVKHLRVHGCNRRCVEISAETFLQRIRTCKGLLSRHLLVDRKSNEKSEWVLGEQRIRVRFSCEVDGRHVSHNTRVPRVGVRWSGSRR